jgi:class 3 adenylate cyclase/tetratricopeptide (TPR) repeat protein
MPGGAGGDERKVATVLFADLAGSTALADREDPERVRARLERFYEAMREEIELAGGTIEKFAGDAVMAVFGAPTGQEDHAERALHAALAIRRRLRELFGDGLGLRIGVNSGDVVTGAPREGSSFVSGDAVNVAARLEQAAVPGEILVGERTVAAVRGAFEFEDARSVDAKGKPGGVACRRLVRALSLQRPRGVSGLPAAFVGRDAELARLQDAYREAVDTCSPRLEVIVGDPGVGKTRLVRELWQWLAAQEPQPLQRTGRCLSYGQIAYWALGEILKEHFGVLDSDPPETLLERLRGREILGLALGLDVAGDAHPLAVRDRFQDAWSALLDELAAERPVALLVEDLHWAEEPLLDLLEQVLETVRGPLLVIATARPELHDHRPGFGVRLDADTIALEPLPAEDTERLLSELLGAEPPPALLPMIAHAEGNPFFLEEVLGSLLDGGLLERRGADWVLAEPAAAHTVPDTVQAVVAARIDLLEPADKAALQAASLIGRVFWSGPVYELLAGVEPELRVLEERDFIRRRPGSAIEGEREYAVKHAVTREVAYASIPKARRARLHAAFAAWLERFGGGRDEHAPLLAHHFAEAARAEDADLAWAAEEQELERLREQAASWLERAARLAVARYDIEEALAYLHRALDYQDATPARARIWRAIGGANAFKFDGEAFWTAMQNALQLADERQSADVYSELAFHTVIRSGMWRKRPQPQRVDVWIDRALELAEPGSPARVRALTARAHWHQGDDASAREASSLADSLGDPELRSYAWMARSSAAFHNLRFGEACMWAQLRFGVADRIDDPDQVLEIYETAIPTTAAMGRIAEARRLAGEHVALAGRLTPHHRMHGVAITVETEEAAGDWVVVRDLRPRIEDAVEANADTPCVRNARTLLVCAVAHEIEGDAAAARELERAAADVGFAEYDWALIAGRMRLAVVRGDRDAVHELLGARAYRNMSFGAAPVAVRMDALALVRDRERIEVEAPPLLQPRTLVQPFALRALGIARGDGALLTQADARFASLGLDWYRAQTEKLLSV